MPREYIEARDGGYWVAGTRVSLDSIVYGFLRGESPESISRSFPALTLEEVYGAIAFYLANEQAVDALLGKAQEEFQALKERARAANAELYKKLEDARQNIQAPRR